MQNNFAKLNDDVNPQNNTASCTLNSRSRHSNTFHCRCWWNSVKMYIDAIVIAIIPCVARQTKASAKKKERCDTYEKREDEKIHSSPFLTSTFKSQSTLSLYDLFLRCFCRLFLRCFSPVNEPSCLLSNTVRALVTMTLH